MALADQVKARVLKFINTVHTATTATVYSDGGFEFLEVNKRPIISVTSVINVEPTTAVTATATTYDFYPEQGWIFKKDGSCWESSSRRRKWKITVSYGLQTIPADMQLAIDMWVQHLTENVSGNVKSYKTGDDAESYGDVGPMPSQVRSLLQPYVKRGL
jgi:hypothetical protein